MKEQQKEQASGVPVRVMLPLDTFVRDQASGLPRLKDPAWLDAALGVLAASGVEGVSADVWWGMFAVARQRLVFDSAVELARLCQQHGLHLTCIMSFHVCGNSVGDTVHVPMPAFVTGAAPQAADSGFYCADCRGRVLTDAFSPAADELPLVLCPGEAPTTLLSLYADFMAAFARAVGAAGLLGRACVDEVAVGMGPCSELRFPSYDKALGWSWPQAGTLVCFDAHTRRLAQQRGVCLPTDADAFLGALADANERPPAEAERVLCFASGVLAEHADRLLAAARTHAFPESSGVRLSVKFAGIHWLHSHPARLAEACAGYWDYSRLLRVVAQHGAGATFTCYDMDTQTLAASLPGARCDPDALVVEFAKAAREAGVAFLGAENSLEDWGADALATTLQNVARTRADVFTFLRVTPGVLPLSSRARAVAVSSTVAVAGGVVAALAVAASRGLPTGWGSRELAFACALMVLVLVLVLVAVAVQQQRRRGGQLSPAFVRFVACMAHTHRAC